MVRGLVSMPFVHVFGYGLTVVVWLALGCALARGKRVRWPAVIGGAVLGGAGYLLEGRPGTVAALLPPAGAVFYTNWYPWAVALAAPAAVMLGKGKFQRWRIGVLAAVLLGVALLPLKYYWKPAAQTGRAWVDENGICRQSAFETCAPAAGVTLARLHGIETDEAEMARLALTKEGQGTRTLGLYRALRTVAARKPGGGARVRVRHCSVETLLAEGRAAVVVVGLPVAPRDEQERQLAELYQWSPGVMHEVVLLGVDETDPEKVKIGEPDFGLERWQRWALERLYRGTAIVIDE
jgi:hypothetical protein